MNPSSLHPIETPYIQLDWKDYINRINLTVEQLNTIIDMMDVFKNKKDLNELVIIRFEKIPAYITIKRNEYGEMLDWMYEFMISNEYFEYCKRIKDLIKEV